MALRGKGMLVTFTEVAAADEAEFNEWYNREHMDERVEMPGFRRARRYVATKGDPKYLATYECGSVADLAAPAYLKRLASQSEWSRRVMGRFTKFQRLTLRIRADATHATGGAIACVRFFPDPARARALARWLKEEALPAAIAAPGMLGGFAGENDLETANAPARAQGVAFPEASETEWAVMVEAADPKAAEAAAKAQLTRAALRAFGTTRPPTLGLYRLIMGVER